MPGDRNSPEIPDSSTHPRHCRCMWHRLIELTDQLKAVGIHNREDLKRRFEEYRNAH